MKRPYPFSDVPAGPPWIGPVTPRARYERSILYTYLMMVLAAVVFFGWRALWIIMIVLGLTLVLYGGIEWMRRMMRHPRLISVSPLHAMNVGLLTALTLPVVRELWYTLAAGVLAGVLVHLVGPAHRLRVHPLVIVHLVLLSAIMIGDVRSVDAVLSPRHVVTGELLRTGHPTGGPMWIQMSITEPNESVRRQDPGQVMLAEQKKILRNEGRLAALMHPMEPTQRGEIGSHDPQLARMLDVVIGAVPGAIGVTCKLLIIFSGLYLIQNRISRWPAVLVGLAAAIVALLIMPIHTNEGVMLSAVRFADVGWRIGVSYIGYQLLATPILLILLIIMPMTMPRSPKGRLIYAIFIGAGVVIVRWYVPYEGASYLPLLVAGLVTPLLDHCRTSSYVWRAGLSMRAAAE